ncbi:MAG: outer membrane beta-barrel protein [Asticcacaulis sp.]
MRLYLTVISAAFAMCATQAMAENNYVSVYGGKAGGFDYDYKSSDRFSPGEVKADFKSSNQFGIALGRTLPNRLRAEMSLSTRNHDVKETVARFGDTTYINTIEGEAKVMALDLNVYYDIPVAKGFNLYVGGGVGVATVEINDTYLNDEGSALSLVAMGGASYDLGTSASVFAEARWQRVGTIEIESPTGIDFSDAEIDLTNTAVLGGIRFRF